VKTVYNFKENMFTIFLLELPSKCFEFDMDLYPRKV